jgi:hypothetical protein
MTNKITITYPSVTYPDEMLNIVLPYTVTDKYMLQFTMTRECAEDILQMIQDRNKNVTYTIE